MHFGSSRQKWIMSAPFAHFDLFPQVDGANKAAVRGERVLTPEERKAADDL
jgi:hypothetical protein